MNLTTFLDRHNACPEERDWAISTGCATIEEVWLRPDLRPAWRVWVATRPGVLPAADQRRFACWCVRQVWRLLTDERSRRAVEVAK